MSSIIHTKGGTPDTATHFSSLVHNLREAQNDALVLGHLHGETDPLHAKGWFAIAENLDVMITLITGMAAKGVVKGLNS